MFLLRLTNWLMTPHIFPFSGQCLTRSRHAIHVLCYSLFPELGHVAKTTQEQDMPSKRGISAQLLFSTYPSVFDSTVKQYSETKRINRT